MISRIEVKLARLAHSIFYFFVWSLMFIAFTPFCRVRVEGKSNIPKKGRYIIAANHKNFFDGFFLTFALGPFKIVRFIIAKRALKRRWARILAILMGSVLIGNELDDYQKALKKLNRILSHGGKIGIFPEGNISKRKVPGRFKGGVAKLSLDSKSKVVPVYIEGTYNLRYFKYWLKTPEIVLKIGKPVDLYNYASSGNNLDQMAAVLREKIISLAKGFELESDSDSSFDEELTFGAYKSNQRETIGNAL